MDGVLFINGLDAYTAWGVFLEGGSRNKLIMGVPLKELTENKSRLEHGKSVLYGSAKQDERDVELVFWFAKKRDFVTNYRSFLQELYKGEVKLKYKAEGIDETYRLTYLSSRSLSSIDYLGKVSVRFNEPNPSNRAND